MEGRRLEDGGWGSFTLCINSCVSRVTIEIKQTKDDTKVTITQTGVPSKEVMSRMTTVAIMIMVSMMIIMNIMVSMVTMVTILTILTPCRWRARGRAGSATISTP